MSIEDEKYYGNSVNYRPAETTLAADDKKVRGCKQANTNIYIPYSRLSHEKVTTHLTPLCDGLMCVCVTKGGGEGSSGAYQHVW